MNLTRGRVADLSFAVAFLASAWVQTNDPDPMRWVAVYLFAATLALWPGEQRPVRVVAGLLGVAAAVWCVFVLPEASRVTRPGEIVRAMSPDRPQTEAAREVGGLLLILVFALQRAFRRPPAAAEENIE